ncbi:hemocyte protein-glutamine gamma-glutamyltransferase-like [Harmonia axyridis]|uniref:hemocyte protein-glutamine gamma-glutamyltransferase-like n=1 Tax=Harmonia axyridis TaxID=115357 RepID=UPI001E279458|nr:hemocyte protein-glutamine gamma-glutamyltransferase-like [Harmonia axyridis]
MGLRDLLNVETIYLYVAQNASLHKTDMFDLVNDPIEPTAIFRRGMKFTLAIRFTNAGFSEGYDRICLRFDYGPTPNPLKSTRGVVNITSSKVEDQDEKIWYGNLLAKGDDTVTVEVSIPPSVPVGIWRLQIETSKINSPERKKTYTYPNDIYILFNPWVCEDLVFMPEKRLLDEYVLQEVGKIWVGAYGSAKGREWVFGQFNACILPAIMLMMDRSNLPHSSRGDPVKVSRMISKMVNSNDEDGGILIGDWSGDYSEGTAPSAWTGSVAILQEYLDTQEPVPFGQCWVFAGVVTTVCRALGIPSRVVSNLVSAHDTNSSLTIDKYYNKDDEPIEGDPNNPNGEDSIWNYHVWNDVWMARPDLPSGYGGWQAIDATPQETSANFYQCGPASLEAIKQGAVCYNYDVEFMVSSVNADVLRWKEDPHHVLGYAKIYCNKYHIGRMILTKKPFIYDPNGDRDREEITSSYKQKEGTEAERVSLYNAVRGSEIAKKFFAMPDREMEDMEFELKDIDKVMIGETFEAIITIKNKGKEVRHIGAVITAYSVYYTGVKAHLIEKAKGDFSMPPGAVETLKMTIPPAKYLDKLVEYGMVKLYAAVTVKETRQTWADEDDFQVLKPPIRIQIPAEIPLQKNTTISLGFKNPLNMVLTKCKFYVHGPALLKNYILACPDVQPQQNVSIAAGISPRSLGEHVLVATFHSSELHDVTGSVKIHVY